MVKILLADDDALIRESLKIIFDLDDRFQILHVCNNGQEALDANAKSPADVAILDVRMPILNGVEATKGIVSQGSRVMILTTFDEDDYIKEAFKNGASGYLLKNSPPDAIKNAVLTVATGNTVIQDMVMTQFSSKKSNDLSMLTKREIEVVELISKGLTNYEIAKNLFLSEGTVKNTVSNILSKLDLKHRTQIAIYYLE